MPRRGLLFNALERLRSLFYLLSTYLPRHVVAHARRRPVPGQAWGQTLGGSLLFADVSGFTALSERLAGLGQEGAEQLTAIMNGYFQTMLDILGRSGGVLLKFAGDAMLVHFPEQDGAEHARWAVRAAERMMVAMQAFAALETPLGAVALQMKVGISSGPFLAVHAGNEERMEYVLLGEAVSQTMAAEGAAAKGLIVVDGPTAAALGAGRIREVSGGFYRVVPRPEAALGDFEVTAERRRARGAIPWDAQPHALIAQMQVVLRQIEALVPYLPAELVERIVGSARRRQLESEFRPTTVLFANFTGFEALWAAWGRRGQQRLVRILSDYFSHVQEIVKEHGGAITRIDPYGDGSKILILFGAPVAHEDDARRAAGTALAMQRRLQSLNREWERAYTRYLPEGRSPIRQRIGLTQGVTFAGQVGAATRREYTVMGDDVNLAARLMSAADPGQILANPAVYEEVKEYFALTALAPIRVKGKSEAIPIFELGPKEANPIARRWQRREAPVGRAPALARGRKAVQQAAGGRGQFLLLSGPAGSGKSHLADTLALHAVARQMRVFYTEAHAYGLDTPYAPWKRLLLQIAGITPDESGDSAGTKLHSFLETLELAEPAVADPLAHLLAIPLRAQPPTRPASTKEGARPGALFEQLGRKLEKRPQAEADEARVNLWQLAGRRPAPASGRLWQQLENRVSARRQQRLFAAVESLLRRLSQSHPLFLCFENGQWLDPASRQLLEYVQTWVSQAALLLVVASRENSFPGGGARVRLPPLKRRESAALVHALWPEVAPTLDPETMETIHRQSGGNPLFVKELVAWARRQAGDPAGGAWQQRLDQALRQSLTVQELMLSRVDTLPALPRSSARLAAVAGSLFSGGEVQALADEKQAPAAVARALAELAELDVILRTGSDHFGFEQALLAEVLYNSQSFARRRALHRRLAAYLEAEAGQQPVERIAYHYEQAHAWLPAARFLLQSGDRAQEQVALAQADGAYARALRALGLLAVAGPAPARLRGAGYEGRADVALARGQYAAAAGYYARSVEALAGKETVPALLLLKQALAAAAGGDPAAPALGAQAWEKEDRPAWTAPALAWIDRRTGRGEEAGWLAAARAQLPAAAEGEAALIGRALLADLAGEWGEATRAYRALGRPAGLLLASVREGDRQGAQGNAPAARRLYEEAVAVATAAGDAAGLALALYRLAAAGEGRPDAAETLARAQALLAETGERNREDLETVAAAQAAQAAGKAAPWPEWRWRSYRDRFYLSLLCPPGVLRDAAGAGGG